jgi:hypothetical protein
MKQQKTASVKRHVDMAALTFNPPYAAKRGLAGERGSDRQWNLFESVLSQRSPSASLRCADIRRDLDYRRDNSPSEGNQVLAAPTWRSGQPSSTPLPE